MSPNNTTSKPDLTVHAARLREMAADLSARAQKSATDAATSDNLGYIVMARMEAAVASRAAMDAQAMFAGAAALERAAWRPIAEAHEDFGPLVVIDMLDPGTHDIAHVCNLDWADKTEGMTHFAQLPLLTEEMVQDAQAAAVAWVDAQEGK